MKHLVTTIICLLLSLGIQAQESYSLNDAINFALENHLSLKSSELDGETAKWQYKEALSIGLPNIKGNVNYTYFYQRPVQPTEDFLSPAVYGILFGEGVIPVRDLGPPATFEFAFVRKNELTAGITGEVLVFDGNFLKGLKASKMFMSLAAKQIELTQQEIIQNVTRAYQSVQIAERSRSIIQNNIDNVSKTLAEAEIIYENGFIEELDVDRLKLSLENLNFEKDKLELNIDLSYNVLKFQMAYPLNQDITIKDDLENTVEQLLLNPIQFLEDIDPDKRPEHRLLADAIELDFADLERIKQGYVPSVSANVSYGQALRRDALFNGNEAGFLGNGTIGLNARIPIYDGGFTKSKIEQKKIEIAKKQIELSEFDRAMKMQATNTYTNFENAKITLNAAKRALALNEKIFSKTQIKYNEGVGSSVELTQAESMLYQAQAQYINALYDILTTKTEFDIATGDILNR